MLELQSEGPLFERLPRTFKKLVLVSATSAPMTRAGKKDEEILERILYIHYLLRFHKDKENKMRALIDSGSEVNAMMPANALKLGL